MDNIKEWLESLTPEQRQDLKIHFEKRNNFYFKTCKGTNKDGEKCLAVANNSGYCPVHRGQENDSNL